MRGITLLVALLSSITAAGCGSAHPRASRGPNDLAFCEYGTGRTLCGTWTYDPASDTLMGDMEDFGHRGTLSIERLGDGSVRLRRTDTAGRYLPQVATYVGRATATGYEGTVEGSYRNDLGARMPYTKRWEATGRIPDPLPGTAVSPPGGCTLLAVGATRFSACPAAVDRETARARCEAGGWTLATLEDPTENDGVAAWLSSGAWIGANDAREEGRFVWAGGAPVVYADWCAGEPNSAGDEDCALLVPSDAPAATCWNDGTCTSAMSFVCEAPAPGTAASGGAAPAPGAPRAAPSDPPPLRTSSAPASGCGVTGGWHGMWWLSESHPDELTLELAQNGAEVTGTMTSEAGTTPVQGSIDCSEFGPRAARVTLIDATGSTSFRLELAGDGSRAFGGTWSDTNGGGGEISLEPM